MPNLDLKDVSLQIPLIPADSFSLTKKLVSSRIGGTLNLDINKNKVNSVKVLQNLNYQFSAGDRVGLMGANGSGKSTLLRLLAGVYEPSSGIIVRKGKVCSILNVNVGMNADMTGRENLISIAHHFGMKKRDINENLEQMINFTELGSSINLPVRSYSSGMTLRLGYAVTTFLNSEILLLDENLGVGDLNFSQKASKNADKMLGNANILVMASHDIDLMKRFCNKAILLDKGKIVYTGKVKPTFEHYRSLNNLTNRYSDDHYELYY